MVRSAVRVVLAEDSSSTRARLADLLRDEGLEVDETADGRTALDLCRIVQPDLIMLDIGLPKLDGWQVLEKVRGDRKLRGTPVLMISADSGLGMAARALEAGASDFLSKSADTAELLARVRRSLREKAQTDALAERNSQLAKVAVLDPLTGLPNRRAGAEALEQALGAHPSVGVALIDIDHFKSINDRYGHAVGDQVLCAVAGRLSDHATGGDFVARWGGEEFIAVLPRADRTLARASASGLQAAASQPVRIDGEQIAVTVSVGWASTSPRDAASVLERADAALYEAKAAGRDCVRAAD